MQHATILSLGLFLAAGCNERNPHYCPDEDMNLCRPDAAPTACTGPDQCTTAGEPVCKLPDGVCVQCTADANCDAANPVCDTATNRCGPCTDHGDCAATSGVCMPDGSCAAESDVAYVTAAGMGTCTKAAPCNTINAALLTNKPVISVGGMITGDSTPIMIEGKTVTLVGDGATAEIRRTTTGLTVRGANTNVTLFRLRVAGGTGHAIELLNNSGAPKLTLERVIVGPSDQYGVFSNGGDITMTRSIVKQNRDGALSFASNTAFKIINNIMNANGETSAPGSAIEISGSTTADAFELNTVSGNVTSAGLPTTLDCSGMAIVRNNIFYDNLASGTVQHVTGNCNVTTNIIGPGGVGTPANNMDVNPMFVSAGTENFKLQPASPARNLAAPGTPTTGFYAVDFEGLRRPNPTGEQADLGAHEIP